MTSLLSNRCSCCLVERGDQINGAHFNVQECYELSAEYEGKQDPKKLEELGNMLTSLDPGDSIVVAKSFSHMLNLANLAEEVQIAHRRRNKLKKGIFTDENNATTESDIEETIKRLVVELKKSPEEVFDALKESDNRSGLYCTPYSICQEIIVQKHGRFALPVARVDFFLNDNMEKFLVIMSHSSGD